MENTTEHQNSLANLVANNVSAKLAYIDKDLMCRYANLAFCDWFSEKYEDLVNKKTIKSLLGPNVFAEVEPFVRGVLEGRKQTYEAQMVNKNGELKYTLINLFPHFQSGEVLGYFVHVADISSNKFLEIELVNMNQVFIDQNKRLLNFANTVTHNLQNYSFAFETIAELMSNADSDAKKENLLKQFETIAVNFGQSIKNLSDITDAQNKGRIPMVEVSLQEYVINALNTLTIKKNQIKAIVKSNIAANTNIKAIPSYLESIIVNLLSNALKYKHPDREPVIELVAETVNNEILLSVTDNGSGIDLAKYGKDLFGMYKAFKGNADSHGVGLYITKFQVEAMGGRIEVESTLDVGTTFKVYFQRA